MAGPDEVVPAARARSGDDRLAACRRRGWLRGPSRSDGRWTVAGDRPPRRRPARRVRTRCRPRRPASPWWRPGRGRGGALDRHAAGPLGRGSRHAATRGEALVRIAVDAARVIGPVDRRWQPIIGSSTWRSCSAERSGGNEVGDERHARSRSSATSSASGWSRPTLHNAGVLLPNRSGCLYSFARARSPPRQMARIIVLLSNR